MVGMMLKATISPAATAELLATPTLENMDGNLGDEVSVYLRRAKAGLGLAVSSCRLTRKVQ